MPRISIHRLLLAACIAILLTSACGKKRTSASAARKAPARAAAVKPGTTQEGLASWYGEPYHGRRAANGEVYDMNKMTAAHRTLPFNTLVQVLNLDNQQEVQVRINDRGPFVGGRIIDLSRAAAQQIAMVGPGVAKVRIEVLGVHQPDTPAKAPAEPSGPVAAPLPAPPAPPPSEKPAPETRISSTGYAVQIGAFSEAATAEKLQRRMASRYGNAYIENVRSDQGTLYRVRVGPKSTLAEAAQVAASLQQENFPSLVVRVDSPMKN